MTEIYWLTRLEGLEHLFIGFVFFSIIGIGIGVVIIGMLCSDCNFNEKEIKIFNKFKKIILNLSFIMLPIGSLGLVFIPTTKEALAILGIGGSIDYIKSNDKIKQLPDKCVNALDKLIDEYINEDNYNNKIDKKIIIQQ